MKTDVLRIIMENIGVISINNTARNMRTEQVVEFMNQLFLLKKEDIINKEEYEIFMEYAIDISYRYHLGTIIAQIERMKDNNESRT